ncbi:MAG: hypothetical protein KGZ58_05415 [Ignavibacteriales bacterium]|nr:hypothetical protein [Ignavibacteriales bacterium]
MKKGIVILSVAKNLFFLFLFSFCISYTQQVSVSAKPDTTSILIGDHLNVNIEMKAPNDVVWVIPLFGDSLNGFEILKQEKGEKTEDGENVVQHLKLVVSRYDSGKFVFPPLGFFYHTTSDTLKRVAESRAFFINVNTLEVDVQNGIRDIKPPLSVPWEFWEIMMYVGIVVVILAAMYLAWRYYEKKKLKQPMFVFEEVKRPPHEVALEALRSLEGEKLYQRGFIKQFHSEVTEIIRRYIEGRYAIQAIDMTSDEILSAMRRKKSVDKETMKPLENFFSLADWVKFAKYTPSEKENEEMLPVAIAFVERTMKIAEEVEEREKVEVANLTT